MWSYIRPRPALYSSIFNFGMQWVSGQWAFPERIFLLERLTHRIPKKAFSSPLGTSADCRSATDRPQSVLDCGLTLRFPRTLERARPAFECFVLYFFFGMTWRRCARLQFAHKYDVKGGHLLGLRWQLMVYLLSILCGGYYCLVLWQIYARLFLP